MKYSVVDVAPAVPGVGKHEALVAALAAADEAEALGYHRIWYAEHHNTTGYAAQDSAPLIAAAAQRTSRIRVGSGAVLLNHYSPFSVAERYLMLEAMTPGRIDLGLGRASSGRLVDQALRRDRDSPPLDDYGQQIQEVVAYLHHAFVPGHPFGTFDLTAGIDGVPEIWVLGSSGTSASLAGRLGIGYVFGGHINPPLARAALHEYRESFVSTPFGSGAPQAMLTLNIVAADDEELAHRLTWPARALRSLGRERPIPTLRQAEAELSDELKAQTSQIHGFAIPPQISGTPKSLRAQIEPIVRAAGASEIMVHDMIVDRDLRSRSRELIAEALASIDLDDY